jgi:hypothetical protein
MDSYRDHLFQDFGWRLHMRDARFYRPWPEGFDIVAVSDSDGHILVPWHLPVGAGCLVKENSANRKGSFSENIRGDPANVPRMRKIIDFRRSVKQVSNCKDAAPPPNRFTQPKGVDGRNQSVDFSGIQHTGDRGKSVGEELPTQGSRGWHALSE